MSGAIAERLGQEEVATGRVNEQIMQGLVLDLLSSSEGEMVLDAKQISTLARALSDLARAQKAHMDVSALAQQGTSGSRKRRTGCGARHGAQGANP